MSRLFSFAAIGAGTLVAIFAVLSFVDNPEAAPAAFTAGGNEPSWRIEVTEEGIAFRALDGKTFTISPVPEPESADGIETYTAEVDGETFAMTVADKICVDTMSGMPHPKTVAVTHGGRKFSGCGVAAASLLHGEWSIEEIDGKPVIAESEPTLTFDPDGRAHGHGSCNRFFGSYALTGEGLTISEMGQSSMACDQPLMEQEYAFTKILEGVSRFDLDQEGRLVLHGGDGRTVRAAPTDAAP